MKISIELSAEDVSDAVAQWLHQRGTTVEDPTVEIWDNHNGEWTGDIVDPVRLTGQMSLNGLPDG